MIFFVHYFDVTFPRLGGFDVMDCLFPEESSNAQSAGEQSQWKPSQLQLIAQRFVHSFDYEHFSQFPCALESLPKSKYLHIKNTFEPTPALVARAKHLAKRFPPTRKEQ
jgi:hypothetical protein